MPTKKIDSPNRKIRACLVEAGRIRFGPVYYELRIAPFDFEGRAFGDCYLWSRDSRYLAVQETLSLEYTDGPHTELLLIDFVRELQCPLSKVKEGYMVPVRFERPFMIYKKQFRGRGEVREFEIDFSKLDRWRPLEKTGKTNP